MTYVIDQVTVDRILCGNDCLGVAMIKTLKSLFAQIQEPVTDDEQHNRLETACAVLLCEVMRADGLLHQQEIHHIKQALISQFPSLSLQVDEIIEQAIILSENATDFYQFTAIVNQAFSHQQRIEMVTRLWQVALADGEIASIEEHIIRKIADLLHLRHSEYIQAKNSIQSR